MNHRQFFRANWAAMQQATLYRPNPTFENPPFESAPAKVLIVRLSPFRDVDRSTPHLFLFQATRRALPRAFVDFAFFPPRHDRAKLQEAGMPLLVGVQSWRDARDFDLVLISNAYTLELINLPYLWAQSGIPMMAGERGENWPPFILGGSNAMAAQAMITPQGDSFVDAIFFGEGEGEVETLLRTLHQARSRPKRERLRQAAAQVRGLWLANEGQDQTIRKAVNQTPQAADLPVHYPLLDSPEAENARLQINFGCPAFCSFCFEGYDRKPYRELPLPDLINAAEQLRLATGAEAVDLYSFNFNTYADIMPLLLELNRRFARVGLKSQRVDVLASTPGLLEAEIISGKRSFTLGIEGISRRMRIFLHKSLSDRDIHTVLAQLLARRVREIKLFYILTGHETKGDIAEFHDFVASLKAQRTRGTRIIFSFGRLIRMPFTPLRYDRLFLDEAPWRAIIGPVKSLCETHGFEFRMSTPWKDYATSQVLALGGTWLHEPVRTLARQGHYYDEHLTPGYWSSLRRWMEQHGLWESFVAEKGPQAEFALAFVQGNISARFLYRQYQQLKAGEDNGYCLGKPCLGCGACDATQREALRHHALRQPDGDYYTTLKRVMQDKQKLKPLYAKVRLPEETAGMSDEWRAAFVMRTLLRAHPALRQELLSAREALFTLKPLRSRWRNLHGETVYALTAWHPAVLRKALARGNSPLFCGWLDSFTPGEFRRLTLHLSLQHPFFPDAGAHLRRFLQAAYVPVNIRKHGEGYQFDIPRKSLKKKALLAGSFHRTAEAWELRLEVGPKFDLAGYLRTFPAPSHWRRARVVVSNIQLAE